MGVEHELICRLARQIAPDEEEFAAAWLDDYLAGGKARAGLAPSASAPGGAAAENIVLMIPGVIWALGAIAPKLPEVMLDDRLSDICKALKNAFEWMSLRQKVREQHGHKTTVDKDETPPSLRELQRERPHSAEIVFHTTQLFKKELCRRGVAAHRASEICYSVLEQVISSGSDGEALVRRLAEAK